MKKLKRRIIHNVAISLLLVFSLTITIVYFTLSDFIARRADATTQLINTNDGVLPKLQEYNKFDEYEFDSILNYDEESAFRTRYFVLYFDQNKNITKVDIEHIAAVDNETAKKIANKAFSRKTDTGYIGEYRFRITSGSQSNNMAIFVDCNDEMNSRNITIVSIIMIALMFTVLITLLFAFLSNKVIGPFEENARMQKQFITDASHELKTPLAVISANAEVLEYKDGGNEWITNIKTQIERMSGLINDLLTLSRIEEFDGTLLLEEVNISKIAEENLNSFNEVFAKKNVKVISKITPDIVINANPQQIGMLISILVENASKYVTQPGEVEVSLTSSLRYTTFKIYNTAQLSDDIDCKKLFDRFYRPDSSRATSTGGHGIGLSIAKKITGLHNGSISAKRKDNGIVFTAEISNSLKRKNKKHKNKKSSSTNLDKVSKSD